MWLVVVGGVLRVGVALVIDIDDRSRIDHMVVG